jgi:hypothetical protein
MGVRSIEKSFALQNRELQLNNDGRQFGWSFELSFACSHRHVRWDDDLVGKVAGKSPQFLPGDYMSFE